MVYREWLCRVAFDVRGRQAVERASSPRPSPPEEEREKTPDVVG